MVMGALPHRQSGRKSPPAPHMPHKKSVGRINLCRRKWGHFQYKPLHLRPHLPQFKHKHGPRDVCCARGAGACRERYGVSYGVTSGHGKGADRFCAGRWHVVRWHWAADAKLRCWFWDPETEYFTRCVYWGDFVDLPTYSTVKCMCSQAVKGITIAHTTLCPLTVSSMSLLWVSAGIAVTHTQSNGDRVPATTISASECGQSVSIEQPRNQGMTFFP